jgi:hypothetical protein
VHQGQAALFEEDFSVVCPVWSSLSQIHVPSKRRLFILHYMTLYRRRHLFLNLVYDLATTLQYYALTFFSLVSLATSQQILYPQFKVQFHFFARVINLANIRAFRLLRFS